MRREIIDLSGKKRKWVPRGGRSSRPSSLHMRAFNLVRRLFPGELVLQEVKLPGGKLRIDLMLPEKNLFIEIQGQQHTKYNFHFHGGPAGFVNSALRDEDKRKFCRQNNFTLIELPFNENDHAWSLRIISG